MSNLFRLYHMKWAFLGDLPYGREQKLAGSRVAMAVGPLEAPKLLLPFNRT